MTGAGFKGTTVSPTSLVHLPPPCAECVVGGLWSAVRVGRDFLKEHLCVPEGAVSRCPESLCIVNELIADSASLVDSRSNALGLLTPALFFLSVTSHW